MNTRGKKVSHQIHHNYELTDTEISAAELFDDLRTAGANTLSVTGAARQSYRFPVVTAQALGSEAFKKTYGARYAYYAGSMANGISSAEMAIALGRAGFMGSFGSGGLSLSEIANAIDRIKAELPEGPYLVNLLHSPRGGEQEEQIVSLCLQKSVRAIEASAFIDVSPALIRYRLSGYKKNGGSGFCIQNRIIAKVSREEAAKKFMNPPDPEITASLLAQGLITAEQANWSKDAPVADDITAEADSGGHTDNSPLVSLLPLIIAARDEIQRRRGYKQTVRVGAAGGIGTAMSAAGAFLMGADYIATGSVNQACVEAGTSDYVKQMLTEIEMADVAMAPGADMFENGARVQVIKKGTMFPMNARKLYELYTRFDSLADIPDNDVKAIEKRIFRCGLDTVWENVKNHIASVGENQLRHAEANGKYKMALIFRWYLGNSSRWAIQGDMARRADMQIWCGKSMGAFNRWVEGTVLESPANRTVAAVADKIMAGAAFITTVNNLKYAGVNISGAI